MPTSDLLRVISSAVVPVVIISACGLLALAFYNRLAAIVSRLRAFQRERLLERERIQNSTSRHGRRLLEHLELQTVRVWRRANLIRLTLLFLLLTIGLLIGCCLMMGLSVVTPKALYAAVVLFCIGLLSMLCSTVAAALELKGALEPVELESQFVTEILNEQSAENADAG
ncbi:MAG TPA: DUF2721 domain-containing protein [Tepidisphaeraceae bacterium]|nr:DUF2721 domain-containing protein [Tepidisphaeraceae bacterium]